MFKLHDITEIAEGDGFLEAVLVVVAIAALLAGAYLFMGG